MKYILKDIRNEPNALRKFRIETPNANYEGYSDKDIETGASNPLKKALLTEQGYICAYCMGRIGLELNEQHKPKIEVEHFEPQETNPEKTLNYQNLLGVCNGSSVSYPEMKQMHHCDKTKGEAGKMNGKVKLQKLDPRSAECDRLIKYDLEGRIMTLQADSSVEQDLNQVLNLNNKALITARKTAMDLAKERLIKEKPHQLWNKPFLQKHLDEWKSKNNGQFRRYCMIAVWFLQELMKKPQYNR